MVEQKSISCCVNVDDTVLPQSTEQELQYLFDAVVIIAEGLASQVNSKKTKSVVA